MTRCRLCRCDPTHAWPRVLLLDRDEERANNDDHDWFFFTEEKILSAIDVGCYACAFLKRGIELFHSLESLRPFQSLRSKHGHLVSRRSVDNVLLVRLGTGKDSCLVLEFVEPDRKLICPILPILTKLSTNQWFQKYLL
jgi:hypothetical protein